MTLSKMQMIKMLRDQTGKGLSECKDIVDKYELMAFEDKVAGALGEEARTELQDWAFSYVVRTRREKALPTRFTGADLYPCDEEFCS